MVIHNIFKKLKKYNQKSYHLFVFCLTLSVLLITSYSVLLYSSVVQLTLPVGGDSRKQVNMIFALAFIGCLVFIIYATGLFIKFKSRETGVFLALGLGKKKLTKVLIGELLRISLLCCMAGIVLGSIVAFIVERILHFFVVYGTGESKNYWEASYGIALGFCFCAMTIIFVMAVSFMRQSNVMDIIYSQRKTERLRTVSPRFGMIGILLLVMGVVLGYAVPFAAANAGFLLPSVWNLTYLLSVWGAYRILIFMVVYHRKGRNPERYYKNIIPFSTMKFQGRQTVWNMLIITLLAIGGLFACFYPPQLYSGLYQTMQSPVDYSISYKMTADLPGREEILAFADQYSTDIIWYEEDIFYELIGSGVNRDWDDEDRFVEDYQKQFKYFEFIGNSAYNRITGSSLDIPRGSYGVIISPGEQNGFWTKFEDMDFISDPDRGKELQVTFGTTVECQQLVRNGITRYVLHDEDMKYFSEGILEDQMVKQVLFNVENSEASYDFAKAYYLEFLSRTPDEMAVISEYDTWQEKMAALSGDEYPYSWKMDLSPENPDLMNYWKYYPSIKILITKTFFQSMSVFIFLFVYVAIICLAAVGVISYTRSISMGMNNRQLFDDLRKLGANDGYIRRCLIVQLNKIFMLPSVLGAITILLFTVLMAYGNDGSILVSEWIMLGMDSLIVIAFFLYQLAVYLFSYKKVRLIINVN